MVFQASVRSVAGCKPHRRQESEGLPADTGQWCFDNGTGSKVKGKGPFSFPQACTLTATQFTNSPNQDFGVWENGGKWGGGDGGKCGGGKGERWGGDATPKLEHKGGKWEKNGRKMGRNIHFSQCHFRHVP